MTHTRSRPNNVTSKHKMVFLKTEGQTQLTGISND